MAGAVPLVAGLSLPDRILHSAWRREEWADPVCQVAPLPIGHGGMTGKVGVRYTSKNAGGGLLAFAMGMKARWPCWATNVLMGVIFAPIRQNRLTWNSR
jgi:hypothetical protein